MSEETPQISLREADIVEMARAIVVDGNLDSVLSILRTKREVPLKLCPNAIRLVKSTLSKGVILQMARRGGWKVENRPSYGKWVSGRLWERKKPPQIKFSTLTMDVLRWLCSGPLDKSYVAAKRTWATKVLIGDDIFLYLLFDAIVASGELTLAKTLSSIAIVRRSSLPWIGFPDMLHSGTTQDLSDRFTTLLEKHVFALEGLQSDLIRRWNLMDNRKGDILSPDDMISIGKAQESVLSTLATVANAANRRDLLGFTLDAIKASVPGNNPRVSSWIGRLDPETSLSKRMSASNYAGVLLRFARQWNSWTKEHQSVRFFEEEEYVSAQELLKYWEKFGDNKLVIVENLLTKLSAMDTALDAQLVELPTNPEIPSDTDRNNING
jgi:hypothetical protein